MYINLSDGVQTPGPRKIDSKFVVTPWPSSSSSGIDFNESLSHPRILFLRQTFFFFFKFKRDAFFSFNFFFGGGWRKGKIATTNFSSTWIVSNKGTQTFIRECTKEEEEKRKKSSMILPQIAANSSFRNCDDLVAPALYRQKQRVRG